MTRYKLYHGDCLEILSTLEAGSIDAVITDPPYGTTACSWDTIIPFEPMWTGIKRVRKPRAAVVLFGSEPFSSHLRLSNIKEYKYDWIWDKKLAGNFLNARKMPLMIHENIMIFIDGGIRYNPQMEKGKRRGRGDKSGSSGKGDSAYGAYEGNYYTNDDYFPVSILVKSNGDRTNSDNGLHPTQKPVALLRYLIRTYTNEGDTVLDFTCGSGSAGVAAILEHRNYIGIDNGYCEKENSEWNGKRWVDVAEWRIKNAAGDFTMTDTKKKTGQMSLL